MALDPKYRLQANRQSLERDYRANPGDESLVFRLVSVLERLEDHDALVELIESAAQRMPGVLDLQMTRARILSSLGDFEAARAAYNAILEREPGHVDAACALVQAGKGTDVGGLDGVQALLAQADRATGDFYKLSYARARLLEDQERYDEAFDAFRLANEKQAALGGMDIRAKQRAAVTVMNDLAPAAVDGLAGKGHPSERPVFIVGMPRSGTSLTEQILSRHPGVRALGEQTVLGEVLRNLIMKAPRNSGPLLQALDGLGPGTWREAGGEYLRRIDEIDADAPRVTDKLPANFALLPWLRLLLPGARIVHVRRHPLATLASCIRTPFADPLLAFTVEDWARFYGLYEALMQRWRPLLGGSLLELDYEDLVSDLPGQARRLVDFAGLDWSDDCLQPERSRRAVHTASFRQVRKGVHMDSVARWKHYERPLLALQAVIDESREWISSQVID